MARSQLRVLHALYVARTQLYHFMAIVIAGMGFFTDAYDFFAISLVTDLIGYQYYQGHTPREISAAINGIALCGAVPGMLVFGWLGDKMGRKRIYGVTLVLMVVTSLASGLSFSKRVGKNVVTVLCFFRFWLGVGIGGDYPLSATIMSEYANQRRRGAFIAAVFAMQGFGNLAAGIVGMVVSAAFMNSATSNADFVWRIVLMFGAVPATLTYYWRMKMPETVRYTALVAKDAKKAASDMSAVLNMDIVPEDEAVNQLARRTSYFFTVAFVDRIGRVRIQLLGFTMMSVFIIGLAVPYHQYWTKHKYGFAVMYGITTFFANFGPNTTTFIIPAEIFPARLRSTCHGISGAFGKIGAIIGIGVFGFLHTDPEKHVRSMLFVLVGCNLVGLVFTLLLPESKGMALEQITGEMEELQPQQDAAAVAAAECIHVVPV
ncbi:hypothetical protein C2845_PM15G02110 [Panicum miliaceum]|uniref:H(+)/Pi cotransporter n=1 Tax=Panicum miliaceum TaxID=4540 RepID=A0A3L6Q9H0_PANMI|nr:hypothetical protein C2845_PM15G02110 [Panicum miliaceum]